jgi:outer membrane protein TolC
MPKLVLVALICLSATVEAQFPGAPQPSSVAPQQTIVPAAVPQPAPPGANGQSQNPFQGSVPSNEAISATLSLSLQDAVQRGLKQNLGLILGDQNTRIAVAQQLRAMSALLPNLTGRVSDMSQQINLKTFGFSFSAPGFSIPSVVGPFNVSDARAFLTQSVLDFQTINNARAARENVKAAQLTYKDSRDLVVLLVASAYLQVIADGARIDESRSEVATAQALYDRASDLLKNGLSPAIDALRARVELQTEQTRLRSYQNDFDKDKLTLARFIGLPLAQPFTLADQIPYQPLTPLSEPEALNQALTARADYQSLEAQIRASELSKRAAHAQRYPSVAFSADYGTIGPSPVNNHGTFTVTGAVNFSIFDGGRIRADIDQADAELEQHRSQLADLRAQIDFQIRSALLDLQTAADQVAVAGSSLDLARQTLIQAQDRFSAGVTDNIEVVQAQNSVASASQTYINSVYAHNLAKVELARAMGMTDERVRQFLGGK